jgi:photosynthetic reaction center cytochrome c subunit
MRTTMRTWLSPLVLGVVVLTAGCEKPPMESVQRGYRGLGMVEIFNPTTQAELVKVNVAPAPIPEAAPGSPPAKTVFKNLQVLGDLSVNELLRQMVAQATWVTGSAGGCPYCHVNGDLASDALYTKVVARRMLQMTQHVNADWKNHVLASGLVAGADPAAGVGVTCFTCHRGQPVPKAIWFTDPGPKTADGPAGSRAGQNSAAPAVAYASLPYDPMTPFLAQANEIKVISTTALPGGNHQSIKQAEWTYGLMMHISDALGVNCTFCHNSRSFAAWDASTPQRTTAWYGIRMVRDLNANFLEPLKPRFPVSRLGPTGDVPKVSCTTCHQGVYKPLYGAQMVKDYPALMQPTATTAAQPAVQVAVKAAAKK